MAHHVPVIPRIMKRLSNVRVRNVATVGGALAHGDPHMDLPPVRSRSAAACALCGAQRRAQLAVEDLFSGYYETVLARNELIASLHIPPRPERAAYYKVTAGSADDWPALGVAARSKPRARRSSRRASW